MNIEDSPPAKRASTMHPEVLVEELSGILIITINRPQAKNAVTLTVAEGMRDALDALDSRDDLSVAVITGAGGTFCAGMDLKGFLRGERPTLPGRGFAGLTEAPPEKPLIAAVEGYALAGGCEIVLACDLVVAARGARFGIPEVKRGLVAAAGGLQRLPERVPVNIAMEWALTGDMYSAERAYELGLVNALTEDGEAIARAVTLAQKIADNGPLAVRASKKVIREHAHWPVAERWKTQRKITDAVNTSQDAREGAQAFADKRVPVWTGR